MDQFEFDGYRFDSIKEMEFAKREAESIAYIKSKLDRRDKEKLRKFYESLLEKQTFVTPVGISFLRELQMDLNGDSAVPVSPVPVKIVGKRLWNQQSMQEKQEESRVKLRNLRIINFFLILIILGMFAVVLYGDLSPFADAEEKIQDKYSAWEQELQEREAALLLRENSN